MNKINCISGLKVKILSKSVGGRLSGIDYKETEIACWDEEEQEGVVVDTIGNYFLPKDLEPIWEVNK